MPSRQNPCKGREAGCTADCEAGGRCESCRRAHNARETARRQERKRKRQCRVCGAPATKDAEGHSLSTCATHLAYYADYAARQRAG